MALFLYSVPYIETEPGIYNDNTFIELLNISEEVQNIIKRQMDLYAKILNSWKLYIQRAQLSKAFRAGEIVKALKERHYPLEGSFGHFDDHELARKASTQIQSNSKLARLLGEQLEEPESCECSRNTGIFCSDYCPYSSRTRKCENCEKNKQLFKCILCLKDIVQLSWECGDCNHPAHIDCIKYWFTGDRQKCPLADCDCQCLADRENEYLEMNI